jgi:hypothetical protein
MEDEDLAQKEYDQKLMQMIRDATLTSAGVGGTYGVISSLVSGATKPKQVLSLALKDAALSGLVGGSGTYLGSKIFGAPREEEKAPYAKRSGIGGALSGMVMGGAVGALAGKGFIKPASAPLLTRYFSKLSQNPSWKNAQRGATAGAAGGGILGGYLGNDEGQALDMINNMSDDHGPEETEMMKEKLREARKKHLEMLMAGGV